LVLAGILYQKDFGMFIILLSILTAIWIVGSGKLSFAIVSLIITILSVCILYLSQPIDVPLVRTLQGRLIERVGGWRDTLLTPEGLQLTRGLWLAREGGIVGIGPVVNSFRLEVADTDMVYLLVIYYFGLVGGFALLFWHSLFLVQLRQIMRWQRFSTNATRARRNVLIGSGWIAGLYSGMCWNFLSVLRAVPLTGTVFPLLSRGGWHLIVTAVILAAFTLMGEATLTTKETTKEEQNATF
jgi:cell division protein FtsW (lipid II flippase)